MHAENNRLSSAALIWKNIAETEEKLNNTTEAMVSVCRVLCWLFFSLAHWQFRFFSSSVFFSIVGSVAEGRQLLPSRYTRQQSNGLSVEDCTSRRDQVSLSLSRSRSSTPRPLLTHFLLPIFFFFPFRHREDYQKAIEIYEEAASTAVQNTTLEYSAREYLFKVCLYLRFVVRLFVCVFSFASDSILLFVLYQAGLCHFVLLAKNSGHATDLEETLKSYSNLSSKFENSNELVLLKTTLKVAPFLFAFGVSSPLRLPFLISFCLPSLAL
jgi:hypothetical protein